MATRQDRSPRSRRSGPQWLRTLNTSLLPIQVLIVDNKDSFTSNLSQLVAQATGCQPLVIGNTESRWQKIARERSVAAIIISPGPGSPARTKDFGICSEVIRESPLPLLGVCLGHQGIGHVYGARVVPAPFPMHGRVSPITHDRSALFEGMPRTFEGVRYHSLCLDRETIPACLEVSASSGDGVVMAVRHVDRPQFGVQFHPESVCAESGGHLIRNFLSLAAAHSLKPNIPAGVGNRPQRSNGKLIARIVHRELNGWIDPQAAFEALFAKSEHSFWLDSSLVVPGFSRFSVMGDASGPTSQVLRYRTRDRSLETLQGGQRRRERVTSLIESIRARLARPVRRDDSLPFDFQTGLVGYFGYELRNEFRAPTERESALPDAAFIDTDRCLVFDHAESRVYLLARIRDFAGQAERWFDRVSVALNRTGHASSRPSRAGAPVVANLADGPETYIRKIRRCQEELVAGESYQICLSNELSVSCSASAYDTYRALRALNPAPHAAYLRLADFALLSSSPERFLRVAPDRTISSKPIKGTAARGLDPESDKELAEWLRTDEKSRSENLMIVDLLRNDIGRVAETGTVQVPKLLDFETYATVHHLVSTVTGRLREDLDCMDCLAGAFPGGSMTGAPKLRTMSIIDRLEERARGVYSGAIGFLSYGDLMDLSIVIRTIVMAPSGVTVASGGGIVAMSDPRQEFAEMYIKAIAPLSALAAAYAGDSEAWEIRYATP